jgi:hypothetical protein
VAHVHIGKIEFVYYIINNAIMMIDVTDIQINNHKLAVEETEYGI